MKKQILTLTMCLALSATSALADGTKNITQKTVVQTKSAITTTNQTPAATTTTPTEAVNKNKAKEEDRKRFEEKNTKERQALYATLGLSPEQKAKAEELDSKTKYGAGPLARKLHVEARKLGSMRAKKASKLSILKQEIVLNSAKNELKKYFRDCNKRFKAILTPVQRKQFNAIEQQKKAEMKKSKASHKKHKYTKPSSEMTAPVKPAAPAPRPDDKK